MSGFSLIKYNFNKTLFILLLSFFLFNLWNLVDKWKSLINKNILNEIFIAKLITIFNDNLLNILIFWVIYFILASSIKIKIDHQRKVFFYSLLSVIIILDNNGLNNQAIISNFNLALTNNLVIIHPFITQIMYGYLLLICSYYILIFNGVLILKPHWILKYSMNILVINSKIFTSSFIILILGALWASQELSWGSWWNWDLIELIALLYFLLSFDLVHRFKKKKICFNYLFYLNTMTLVIVSFLLVRFDTTNSLHSFNIVKNIELFWNTIKELLIVLLTILFVTRKNFFLVTNNIVNKTINNSFIVFQKIITFIFLLSFVNIILTLIFNVNLKLELTLLQSFNLILSISLLLVSLFLIRLKNLYIVLSKMVLAKTILLNTIYKFLSLIKNNETNSKEIDRIHLLFYLFIYLLTINYVISMFQLNVKTLPPVEGFFKKTLDRWEGFYIELEHRYTNQYFNSFLYTEFFLETDFFNKSKFNINKTLIQTNNQINMLGFNSYPSNKFNSNLTMYFSYYSLIILTIVSIILYYFLNNKFEIKVKL